MTENQRANTTPPSIDLDQVVAQTKVMLRVYFIARNEIHRNLANRSMENYDAEHDLAMAVLSEWVSANGQPLPTLRSTGMGKHEFFGE